MLGPGIAVLVTSGASRCARPAQARRVPGVGQSLVALAVGMVLLLAGPAGGASLEAPQAAEPAVASALDATPPPYQSASQTARVALRSSIDLLSDDQQDEDEEDDEDREVLPSETGMASWYGPGFHKRRTASGERFDMHAMTAAHRTLPFGTLVCVRSQATGRGVVVRINDRGPHVRNRVVDLSRGAAMALGVHGLGLKPVDVFPLGADDATCPPKRPE